MQKEHGTCHSRGRNKFDRAGYLGCTVHGIGKERWSQWVFKHGSSRTMALQGIIGHSLQLSPNKVHLNCAICVEVERI